MCCTLLLLISTTFFSLPFLRPSVRFVTHAIRAEDVRIEVVKLFEKIRYSLTHSFMYVQYVYSRDIALNTFRP